MWGWALIGLAGSIRASSAQSEHEEPIGSVKGTRGLRPTHGTRGIWLARLLGWLAGLGDELIGPSPRVMHSMCVYYIYIYILMNIPN
jgi:hypothetical protein